MISFPIFSSILLKQNDMIIATQLDACFILLSFHSEELFVSSCATRKVSPTVYRHEAKQF